MKIMNCFSSNFKFVFLASTAIWITVMSSSLAAVDASNVTTGTGSVTYDRRSLIINGKRKLLISASIHYPRSVPAVSLHWNYTTSITYVFELTNRLISEKLFFF